jgi:hypothetical protein
MTPASGFARCLRDAVDSAVWFVCRAVQLIMASRRR